MKNENWRVLATWVVIAIVVLGGIVIDKEVRRHQVEVANQQASLHAPVSPSSDNSSNSNGNSSSSAANSTQSPAATQSTSCFTASQSSNEIGQTGCVQFTVGSTYLSSKCNAYLNQYNSYTSGFSAWIPDGCGLGSSLISEYANKTIDVSGTITSYEGAPEIEVTSASQVQMAQ